jgi:hypothetical protein
MARVIARDRIPFLSHLIWRQLDAKRGNTLRLRFDFHFHQLSDGNGARICAQILERDPQ